MKIFSLVTGIGLVLMSTIPFAATSLKSNWICTTNASSSDAAAEIVTDKKLTESMKSASDAFLAASTNCRDCTKITCEVKTQ
jgi:hypothetical protein